MGHPKAVTNDDGKITGCMFDGKELECIGCEYEVKCEWNKRWGV